MMSSIARTIFIIGFPVIATVILVRTVMSPLFLTFEYHREGFPPDPYGFTTEDRLSIAPLAVAYLVNNAGIEFLEDLRLPRSTVPPEVCVIAPEDDTLCYMFNARELKHMEDVKVVTQYTYTLGIIALFASGLAGLYLWRSNRNALRVALFGGSFLTLGMITSIIIVALTSWEIFFTGFHQIFFEGDSWLFLYQDTLIRLFPEQFWFDAAIVIGTGVSIIAIITLGIAWRWAPYKNRA